MAQVILDRLKKARLARRAGKQVNPSAQAILQETFQPHKRPERGRRVELNQNIPITLTVSFAAGARTEKPEIADPETLKIALQFRKGLQRIGPV